MGLSTRVHCTRVWLRFFFAIKLEYGSSFFSKKVESGRMVLEYFVKYPSSLNLRMAQVFLAKNVDQAD